MRIMGLDFGKKTIGVAISDENSITAQPLKTILRASRDKDMEELKGIIRAFVVSSVVVGLPVNMDGTYGPQSETVLKFIETVKAETGLPVVPWDERLSTIAVTKVLLEGDISRKKRKEVVDKLAASYILQGYLDSRGRLSP